ncbi:hypothetical protein [Bartonella raoultii]|uniref:Phage related protein n=1 Tax=Bartonella raoultii TaxID=1457020 RepID=A0ABS7I6S2_9HYPH|nr:hypothetical protein [Bartonella raoultii]MBX4336601.1 hypothetical protein [Bartonella raoultii]
MILWIKKYLTLITTVFVTFFMALAKAFFLGKKSEQQKQMKKNLETAKTRLEVENEINKKSDAGVRTELSNWLRDE